MHNIQNHICGKAQFLMPATNESVVHGIYPVTSVIVFSLLFNLLESPCCERTTFTISLASLLGKYFMSDVQQFFALYRSDYRLKPAIS